MVSVLLGIDCDAVLAVLGPGSEHRQGFNALREGCLAFFSLHVHRWGSGSVCITRATARCYTALSAIGLSEVLNLPKEHISSSNAAAFKCTHFIDGRLESLKCSESESSSAPSVRN